MNELFHGQNSGKVFVTIIKNVTKVILHFYSPEQRRVSFVDPDILSIEERIVGKQKG